jgi:hypothetical protein
MATREIKIFSIVEPLAKLDAKGLDKKVRE